MSKLTARPIFALGIMALVLTACGSDLSDVGEGSSDEVSTQPIENTPAEPTGTGSEAPTQNGSGAEVGFSESFLTDPFQVQLVAQLEAQAEEQGVDLLPAVNADGDAAKQNADVATLLGRGVGGLIVVPVDSSAIVPAIEQANEQDVPVVTVDLGADGGDIYMIVRADNVFMGEAACEYMGEELAGQGTVLNLQGDLASANGRDRTDGFTSCMEAQYEDIEVVSRPMNWDSAECTETTQTVVTTEEISGIFMASDSVCLTGVLNVLDGQGLLQAADEEGHLVTVSIDGTPEALDAVRDGHLDAVVSQPLDLYAEYGIRYIDAAMAGETFEPGETDHNSRIVEEGDSMADLLPSPTVTIDNVDDPALWGNG